MGADEVGCIPLCTVMVLSQNDPTVGRFTTRIPRDVLHNSLRSVIARPRAVHCVAFLANSPAIGCKKMPCGPSRSALSPTREGYAGHPQRLSVKRWELFF